VPIGGDGGRISSLRIEWPMPLSKSLSERDLIEKLIEWFVRQIDRLSPLDDPKI
jgi:hypothetical protein